MLNAKIKYSIETGYIPLIQFAPGERKDITVSTEKNILFFDFAVNGNGFVFETSKDFQYKGKKAIAILMNVGSAETDHTPGTVITNVSWVAITADI